MSATLSLEEFLPYRCNRLAERISQAMARDYTQRSGLNIAKWRIVATLGEHGPMLARDISRQTSMDKVRVSRAVKGLLEEDILVSKRLDNDQRAWALSLSEQGKAVYQELVPAVLDWEQRLLAGLDADEQAQFLNLLGKLEQRIDELEP
ncbi:MAG: MarR family transcriptional regulator [Gammaproteobacteria bacterium]|nr:MAG: MarR family transcriptional regulator [Gammaproteobacteria bacterium]